MTDADANPADAHEQDLDAAPSAAEMETPDLDPEVPEADAVEQAQPGPLDDEDGYR